MTGRTETVAKAGAKTEAFIRKISGLLRRYDIKLHDEYVSDNRSVMRFVGTFGKKAKAKDPKQFGGLSNKPFRLDVTLRTGNQVWVTLTAYRGKVQRSYALSGRDLERAFLMVEKATKEMLDEVLAGDASSVKEPDKRGAGRAGKVEKDEEKMDPQKFHKEHGRCPSGYQYDGKRCVESAFAKAASARAGFEVKASAKEQAFNNVIRGLQNIHREIRSRDSREMNDMTQEALTKFDDSGTLNDRDFKEMVQLAKYAIKDHKLHGKDETKAKRKELLSMLEDVKKSYEHFRAAVKNEPAEQKKKDVDPQKYHKEHGRCPSGYRFDGDRNRCIEV